LPSFFSSSSSATNQTRQRRKKREIDKLGDDLFYHHKFLYTKSIFVDLSISHSHISSEKKRERQDKELFRFSKDEKNESSFMILANGSGF
jgi:hypothetical protein